MAKEIVMPRMSDTMESGRIVRWLKKPGERVQKGETLAEIETDKAVMELQSYESGVVEKLLLNEGDSAPIGETIALIGEGAGVSEQPAAKPTGQAPAAPVSPTAPSQAAGMRPPEAPTPVVPTARVTTEPPFISPMAGERVKASPLARRMAESQGVDLAKVHGSGPGGRIVSEDVEAYLAEHAAPAAPPKVAPAPAPAPSPAPAAPAPAPAPPAVRPGETVELSRIRKTINERLAESNATVPTFYVTSEVDMGAVMSLRKQLNAAWAPESLTITDFIVRAVALALAKFPAVNASYRDDHLERHAQVNVAVAVALPDDALMAPVVRDADRKSLREIGRETKGLVERARAGRPAAGDLGGNSLTVSNLGMYDVEEFVAIITPPEAAMLAIGSIRAVPAVVEGEVRIAQRMRVTLSGDHRVFSGETGAKYLQELKRLLQSPLELLQ